MTTTAATPRRAVETTLLRVLAECHQRSRSVPTRQARRPQLFVALRARLQRLADDLARARDIAKDVLDNEALAIAGMGLMFLAFILV